MRCYFESIFAIKFAKTQLEFSALVINEVGIANSEGRLENLYGRQLQKGIESPCGTIHKFGLKIFNFPIL